MWDVVNSFALKHTIEDVPIEDMCFVEWHPAAPVFLTGGKDYMIWLINAQSGKMMQSYAGHENDVLSAQFTRADGGKQIISCSADKTIKLWSPKDAECITTIKNGASKLPFHDGEIMCMVLHPKSPVLMSGASDGTVCGANYTSGESFGRIGQHSDSVESVALSEELNIGVSGGIDSQLFIYDLKSLQVRKKIAPTEYGGYTRLMFSSFKIKDKEGNPTTMLYAASTLGSFFVIDVRDGEVAREFKGHEAPINWFEEAKVRKWIITAGDDNQCNIFKLDA